MAKIHWLPAGAVSPKRAGKALKWFNKQQMYLYYTLLGVLMLNIFLLLRGL